MHCMNFMPLEDVKWLWSTSEENKMIKVVKVNYNVLLSFLGGVRGARGIKFSS